MSDATTKIPGSAHLNLGLGGLVVAGGAAGFLRKGSRGSLVAGVARCCSHRDT
jgi:uncharacterized membrane protein (UPF0136 family)